MERTASVRAIPTASAAVTRLTPAEWLICAVAALGLLRRGVELWAGALIGLALCLALAVVAAQIPTTRLLSSTLLGPPSAWVIGMPLVGIAAERSWRLGFLVFPLLASFVVAVALALLGLHRVHEAEHCVRQGFGDQPHLGDRGHVIMGHAFLPQDLEQIRRGIGLDRIERPARKLLDEETGGAPGGVRTNERDRLNRPTERS